MVPRYRRSRSARLRLGRLDGAISRYSMIGRWLTTGRWEPTVDSFAVRAVRPEVDAVFLVKLGSGKGTCQARISFSRKPVSMVNTASVVTSGLPIVHRDHERHDNSRRIPYVILPGHCAFLFEPTSTLTGRPPVSLRLDSHRIGRSGSATGYARTLACPVVVRHSTST